MIHITEKKNCCGCSACVQRCPKQCISLTEDEEGFLYPYVNEESCVECGLCEKICPILNPQEETFPLQVIAAKNTNTEERLGSSSGGLFLPLAKSIINEGGIVFGADYDSNWEVHHVGVENISGLYALMMSKYLQSRIENTYKEAEKFLKCGRKVMFVGTPCQIAGLHGFLRHKVYPNLLTIDVVCHGAPSPGVWRQYLAETYSEEEFIKSRLKAAAGKNTVLYQSLNAKSPIGDIKFRDKTVSGWKKFRFVVRSKSASKADKNSVLSSDIHYDNVYMKGFLSNLYLRPSCHDCKCKDGKHHSDISLGDFWGIDKFNPSFDDDKGVSLVLINTPKGKEFLQKVKMEKWESSYALVSRANGGFSPYAWLNPKRSLFFKLIWQGATVRQAVAICLHIPLYRRVIRKAKMLTKAAVKQVLDDAGVKAVKKALGK